MRVYSGTCIVTRGDHQSVQSLIGAFESKEAALSALLVPVIRELVEFHGEGYSIGGERRA